MVTRRMLQEIRQVNRLEKAYSRPIRGKFCIDFCKGENGYTIRDKISGTGITLMLFDSEILLKEKRKELLLQLYHVREQYIQKSGIFNGSGLLEKFRHRANVCKCASCKNKVE